MLKEAIQSFNKKFDELLVANQTLTKKLDDLTENHAAQLAAVKERCQADVAAVKERCQADAEVSALQHAVDRGERASRQANLIVYGAPEEAQGATVAATVTKLLGSRDGLLEVRGLGRPVINGAGSKPRPILVRCAADEVKHNAFKRSQELRARKNYLEDDLTPAQLETRAKKRDQFRRATVRSPSGVRSASSTRLRRASFARTLAGPHPKQHARPGTAPPPFPRAPPPRASA